MLKFELSIVFFWSHDPMNKSIYYSFWLPEIFNVLKLNEKHGVYY